ncbi:hypothetical protein KR100_04565 [Synechococcus sp. KORDI-100]|uniref:response regulator n=1 Tax=Synechococcus sp. KORDI-100 TaxID=1280380 RepID=UPI0004E0569B|nr:response regulator [Synechococcus sp. KORDI-100]AII42639.1 hypothetical protein KR100_04565 [Synechococcus sp. KORDI-100]
MQDVGREITVAVVEDNPRIRELLQEEISDEGHRFLSFGTAEEFLKAIQDNDLTVDLVLLDVMLPGMDGLSCLRHLKQNNRPNHHDQAPKIVIVTALNDEDKRRQAMADGAEDYVLKPDLFLRLPELLRATASL